MAKSKKLLSSLGIKDADFTTNTKKKITKKSRKKSKLAPIVSETKTQATQYIHEKEKRVNNPPVGLVTPDSDMVLSTKKYSYDPHFDPQLEWSGKVENSDFEVDTVSLHRHERIDPMTIISKLLKKSDFEQQTLFPFFEDPENNLPLQDAIEFYKHDHNWSNRLVAGDSLLIMNSLLEKEGMEEKVQMIYIDPPYGIKYGSNFQPFVNKKTVVDGKDGDLTQEPEMIKAFRDTWELGIHSYLTYLRNRFLLSRKLLAESGSIFVQISDENSHHVREIMDEIFGSENFVSSIAYVKTSGLQAKMIKKTFDYILWYAKDITKTKIYKLFLQKIAGYEGASKYKSIELPDGTRRPATKDELINPKIAGSGARLFSLADTTSQGNSIQEFEFNQKIYKGGWKTTIDGMKRLAEKNRLHPSKTTINYVRYLDDFPVYEVTNLWSDIAGIMSRADPKIYVVQTSTVAIKRCILMTTDPGDLVFDPTCGSGTTAYVAEQWGRRWITCDTSRVAIALAKQRLVTSVFNYYKLAHTQEGLSEGFEYKSVPHVTLGALANDETPAEEILYDQPIIDNQKVRISGPFTVEAVPSPTVKSIDSEYQKFSEIDSSITRTIENKRQQDWRDELLKTGVRGKGGQKIDFARVETHPASKWIHAIAATKDLKPKIVAVSFGPEYSPLEKNQVSLAISEAQKLVPKPELIIFASLQFDPEAAKVIDELQWPGVQVLKVQVNADLLTLDLKKKRTSNESFWLVGQPDAELIKQKDGKYVIEVRGFDYYNTKSGEVEIESKDSSKIAMWMLDTDYDERSLYPQQVFFPMSDASSGWSKIAKTLKVELNEQLIEHYSGTKSLPFSAGPNKQIAIKIIDDRGIESLRIIKIE